MRSATSAEDDPVAPQKGRGNYELLRVQLQASSDPPALFLRFFRRCSDEPLLSDRPNGQTIARDTDGSKFNAAAVALAENSCSTVVSERNGDHLIVRKPLVA